jgi:hypothetical protein
VLNSVGLLRGTSSQPCIEGSTKASLLNLLHLAASLLVELLEFFFRLPHLLPSLVASSLVGMHEELKVDWLGSREEAIAESRYTI